MMRLSSTDRDFYRPLLAIAGPIALQQLIMSSLQFVDVAMVGQLGETSVASVGLANQITFIYILSLFGITSGSAIFTAQFWGKKDVTSLRKVLGIAISLSLPLGLLFLIIAVFIPQKALGVYTRDLQVIALGSSYLRLIGPAYLAMAISYTLAAVLRSTGDTRLPMMVSVTALSLNAGLSFLLIFGHLGLPALGVRGAAIATLTARYLECSALVYLAYRLKTPPAGRLREIFSFDFKFYRSVIKVSFPVVINEITWALGITTYNIVYARIGTEAIAAVNIASTVEGLAFVLFIALGNASAIMLGNQIGAGEERTAYRYGARFLRLSLVGAVVVGGVILFASGWIPSIYKVSPVVSGYTRNLLMVIAGALWLRAGNLVIFLGILRSGGDTRFAFLIDTGSIWLIGVPLAFLGAFVWRLPVYWVMVLVMADELVKFFIVLARFYSRRWINNLTALPALDGMAGEG
jgi:putative MATE family efflux protein